MKSARKKEGRAEAEQKRKEKESKDLREMARD